jgi:hypothetical protein
LNGIRIVPPAVADFHVGMSLPFILQRQLADLRVQRLEVGTGFPFLGCGRKHLGGTLQQLRPPLADLVRVNPELLRQLDQSPVTLDRGDGHLGFERC